MKIRWKTPDQPAPLDATTAEVCRRLLDGAILTAEKGFFLRDATLELVGSVWRSGEDLGYFDVHISAHRPAGERVPLDGLSVHARGQGSVGMILRVGRQTERGDVAFDGLRAGVAFRLHSPVPVVRQERIGRFAAGPDERAETVASAVYESVDSKVLGTVIPQPDGQVEVVFETHDPSLAGAGVRFVLVDDSGGESARGEVQLGAVRKHWAATWTGSGATPGGGLSFDVVVRQ
jgi:hypothetical protein